eukprot:TRINITY_DN2725_c0_g3_i1.p1 TRINITY_DN2725_c0_g3~~TRINITY_DN2725_c0_g3_i1.p1  ORF type:complete len:420 (+),score=82.13 TRINITY_DN2725_c0_g3_i1:112-1371(+)
MASDENLSSFDGDRGVEAATIGGDLGVDTTKENSGSKGGDPGSVGDCRSSCRRANDDVVEEKEDFECAICQDLWLEPTVTTCGHIFCRACLQQYLVHVATGTRRCPTCRRLLHTTLQKDLAVCRPLARLVAARFPESRQRARADAAASCVPRRGKVSRGSSAGTLVSATTTAGDLETSTELPIFVLDPTVPRQRLHLNVFEPKYVAMVETVLQGDCVFGVVGFGDGADEVHYGVEVAIEECARQPGNRFEVTCIATRPFRIIEMFVQPAGYLSARVQIREQGEASPEDIETASRTSVRFEEWKARLNQVVPDVVSSSIGDALGAAPPPEMPGELAFWIGACINPVPPLGVAPEIRPALLAAATVAERLEVARQGLEESIKYMATMSTLRWQLCRLVPIMVIGVAVTLSSLLAPLGENRL